jgi:protein-disulfide isomerase
MYPGQYQQGDGWSGDPNQQWPQQPGHQQPGHQQPGYQQPGYAQPGYQQPGYAQPGYPQPGYAQPQYQQQPAYPQPYQPPPQPPRNTQRSHVIVVAAVAIVAMLSVVGVAVFVANRGGEDPGTDPTTASGGSASAPAGDGGDAKPAGDPAEGLAVGSGPVRVDIYVDYQCPPCSTFEATTGDILSSNISSGKVTLRIHPVAFIDNRSKNNYATRAAAAAACAHDGGKTLEFHNYLLEHQPPEDTAGPSDEELARAGASLGLNAAFSSCVTGGKRLAWVAQATSAAQKYGVNSVPAAYVNDRKIDATKADLVNAIAQ